MSDIKKNLMLMVWRFQQVNSFVVIFGLSMTLTLQAFPFVKWRFNQIGIVDNWLINLILFLVIFAGAVIVGIIYDSLLKLWIQQQVINIERNPYAKEKLAPKGVLNRKFFFIPMLKKAGLRSEAIIQESWIEHNLEREPILRKDVYRIIKWVNDYQLKPEDKRWLKDVNQIIKKEYSPKFEDVPTKK